MLGLNLLQFTAPSNVDFCERLRRTLAVEIGMRRLRNEGPTGIFDCGCGWKRKQKL